MPSETRLTPHVFLGVLTVLGVVALIVSLDTAPPVARTQLRTAAANTVGASSYVLTYTDIVTTAGHTSRAVLRFFYQSPDRVEEEAISAAGQQVRYLEIGPYRYEQVGATAPWQAVGTVDPNVSWGKQGAETVSKPLSEIAKATSVTGHGDTFSFVPADENDFVLSVLAFQPAQFTAGSLAFTGTVDGEYLTHIVASAARGALHFQAVLDVSQLDHVPSLVRPTAG